MKKFIKITSILAISFLIAACNTTSDNDYPNETNVVETPNVTPAPHPGLTPQPDPTPIQQTEPPDEPIPDMFPYSGYHFTLTAEEREIYERFIVELNTDLFYGLSPISVTKIYIQAGIEGEWEAEFYAHNQESMETTKEEFYEQHRIDMQWSVLESRQSAANWFFPFIDDGEVIIEEDRAVVVFHSVPEPDVPLEHQDTLHVMNLIRNDAGIWEMRFRPHVFTLE